jgi:hypothetical protein
MHRPNKNYAPNKPVPFNGVWPSGIIRSICVVRLLRSGKGVVRGLRRVGGDDELIGLRFDQRRLGLFAFE